MNITDFKSSLEYLTAAELTPFIWGKAGIGKSSIVKQYAEHKGFKFFPFYLGTQSDIGDILGLAEFIDNGDGTKSTAFATPKWMSDMIKYCQDNPDSGAIIFLDEFNRARRDILSGMFSLALDKTFHTIRLPKNCHVVAAGNPPTDEYFTTDIDETALMARFVHVKLEPTFEEWLQFAKNTEIDYTLIEFIRNQPQLLEDPGQEFKLPVKVDRRSFERLNRLFKLKTPTNLLNQLMYGIIGVERAVAYQQFLQNSDKPLTANEILAGEKHALIKKWSDPMNIISSLLNLTCENLKERFQIMSKHDQFFSEKEKENIFKFLAMIPKDISAAFLIGLMNSCSIKIDNIVRDLWNKEEYEAFMFDLISSAKGLK